MDEPLSNLDAKLRVQMRSEIARIQHDLKVTTIYVTHDQTEAMTMGDRVAVIRKGMLQQVDEPADALRPPAQPLRGRLHRLARHEPGRGAHRRRATAASPSRSAGFKPADTGRAARPQGPALRGFVDRRVVIGVRPEDMEDATLVSDAPPERRITAVIELREALGSDVVVHFVLDAPPAITEDVRELAVDVGHEALEKLEAVHRPHDGLGPAEPPHDGAGRRVDRARRRHPSPALLRPRHGTGDLRMTTEQRRSR